MKMLRAFSVSILLVLFSGFASAAPVGSLEANGRFEVKDESSSRYVRFNQPSYTWFSGDTVRIQSGEAVLNLTSGGGIGFTAGSVITARETSGDMIEIEIQTGEVLYAIPESNRRIRIRSGNFQLSVQSEGVEPINVSSAGENVGKIEGLDNGNIRVSVRTGTMQIMHAGTERYSVSAGESIGLLDISERVIKTQGAGNASRQVPLILIQSPERVGTRDEFQIRWESAEPVQDDFVAIAKSGVPADEFETVINTNEGQLLDVQAPGMPGDYEIRFIDGRTGAIKRFVYLDVVARRAAAYWWDSTAFGGALAVATGGTAVYIVSDRDGGGQRETSVSP